MIKSTDLPDIPFPSEVPTSVQKKITAWLKTIKTYGFEANDEKFPGITYYKASREFLVLPPNNCEEIGVYQNTLGCIHWNAQE